MIYIYPCTFNVVFNDNIQMQQMRSDEEDDDDDRYSNETSFVEPPCMPPV